MTIPDVNVWLAAAEGFSCVEAMCWPVGVAERKYAGVTHVDVSDFTQAQADAETLRKSQDLAAKEDLLKRREALERELGEVRDELRDQERRLDRRDTLLTEQQQDMAKKERMVEITQKKLAAFCDLIAALTPECRLTITEAGWSMKSVDTANVAMVSAMLAKAEFEEFSKDVPIGGYSTVIRSAGTP